MEAPSAAQVGQGSQVEDLIQEHISQHLAKLLDDKAKLEKSTQGEEENVGKARLAVSQAEDDLSILHKEMRGVSFQIDAHHREDDARREKNQGQGDDMKGVFVEEADSGEEVGVQADGCKRLARVGSAVVQALQELTATFKRNYGSHGGDDVSSLEGDKPQIGVRGQDLTETPCL